jgi:hypothetical protein
MNKNISFQKWPVSLYQKKKNTGTGGQQLSRKNTEGEVVNGTR